LQTGRPPSADAVGNIATRCRSVGCALHSQPVAWDEGASPLRAWVTWARASAVLARAERYLAVRTMRPGRTVESRSPLPVSRFPVL